MTMSEMYWLTRLDSIVHFLGVSFFCESVFCIFGVFWINGFPDKYDFQPMRFTIYKFVIIVTAFTGLSLMLVPTTRQMAAIIILPKIISNVKSKELPEKVISLADEWLEELKPSKRTKQ